MRAAICLSGFPRNLNNSFVWLDNAILSIFNENNIKYDIFLSFWDCHSFRDVYSNILNKYPIKSLNIEYWDEDKIKELEWKRFKKYDGQTPNLVGMYYQIWKCNELKNKYAADNKVNYDLVFRLRTELHFQNKIDIKELDMAIQNKKEIFLTTVSNPIKDWVKDTFAFGCNDIMDIYSNIHNHLLNLNQTIRSSTPEILLRHWLEINKIKLTNTSLEYKIERDHILT